MKFHVVVVGTPARGPMAEAIASYERRAARYWPLAIHEVRAESARSAAPAQVREREAQRLLERASGAIIACDERGVSLTSQEFARWLQKLRERANDVSFVIGGAFGLDETVRQRATRVLALAPWTLSHDLARLVLAEQLYRAGTLVRGEPYHK
ncbi:MAG TPA: 23S rRNA (pseudouridine(1915)-N(3))-methyltransferase RlmH [Gemmatimonadaceae bacterium]